ncbi:MAG: hypothetical protein VW405_02850 [Rhodospirillaceae bacterium]
MPTMTPIAIAVAVAVVALAAWDAFRRYLASRSRDDRAELDAEIEKTNQRIDAAQAWSESKVADLDARLKQIGNRGKLSNMPRVPRV